MKTLKDFQLVKLFLSSNGIEPTINMVTVRDPEWNDLVLLAREWEAEAEAAIAEEKAKLEAMTDQEKEEMEARAAADAKLEREKILYHSSGHRPERN